MAVACANKLWTSEKLIEGICEPASKRHEHTLMKNVCYIFLWLIRMHYGTKHADRIWFDCRKSINQHCLDLKSKEKKASAAVESDDKEASINL